MSETNLEPKKYTFDFSGLRLCLDFANTLADRLGKAPREHLNEYSDLVAWGQQAGHLTAEQAQRLLATAQQLPQAAEAALTHAIQVREVIFRIFLSLAEQRSPAEADLRAFNRELSTVMCHAHIARKADGFIWDWQGREESLASVLWAPVRSAADVLTSDELHAVKVCAAEDCQWLFLDTSKNQSRRWCDMSSCGNRAKVRRHYTRKKQVSNP